MIAKRLGWVGVVGGLLAQLSAYLIAIVDQPAAMAVGWLAMSGIAASLSGTLVVGALRQDRLSRPATIGAVVLFLVPVLGFGAALLLPPETATDPLVLGLPRRAAIVLLGIGVLPLFILPFAYASDSNAVPLDAEALAALRLEAEQLRRQGRAG